MRYLVFFLFLNLFYSSIYALPGSGFSKNQSEGILIQDHRKAEDKAEDIAKGLNNDGENDAALFESDDEQGNDQTKSNLGSSELFERDVLFFIFKSAISGFSISTGGNYYLIDSEERYFHAVDDWARGLLDRVDKCADNDEEMQNVMQMALILTGQQLISYNKSIYDREDIRKMLDQGFSTAQDYLSSSDWLTQKKKNFSEKTNKIIDVFNESIDQVKPDVMHMVSGLLANFPEPHGGKAYPRSLNVQLSPEFMDAFADAVKKQSDYDKNSSDDNAFEEDASKESNT